MPPTSPDPSSNDLESWTHDPREALDDENDENIEGAVYTPWRFREGEGTPVPIVRVARRHPWSPGIELPLVPKKSRYGVLAGLVAGLARQRDRLLDQWKGRHERWHQEKTGRPSTRAADEWLAYYQGLYRGHEPQPALFQRLLCRNGVPDWSNPFREGEPGYYDFHPEGLLASDVEAILRGIQQDWGPSAFRSEEIERHRQMARLCWALVVCHHPSMNGMGHRLHVSNLNLATMDAALSPDLSRVGLTSSQVLAGAVAKGWQPKTAMSQVEHLIKALSD